MLLPDDDAEHERDDEPRHEVRRAEAKPPPDPIAERRRRRRNWLIAGIVGLLLLIAAIGFGIYWWTTLRWFESTDDAYTQADAVVIAPKVAGYIARLYVTDNQRVKAGDLLIQIDPRDYKATLDQANANLEKDQATLDNARRNFARDAALLPDQLAVTRQQYDNDKAAAAADQATVDSDKAQVEQAKLNLGYTTIASPVDGAVGDRSAQLGAYVQPAQGLMSIVPLDHQIYVVANFKETQIERMFRGEQVDLSIDTFPGVKFTGRVDSLAPGSGAQFALLPPENATGNFTKIVQRVPVKIVIDNAPQARLDQLRPGLSVEADVDSRTAPPEGRRQTLVLPANAPRAAPAPGR
ncbi:MAG TPA: HlyD family secretion protein [Stellaceae bacterium]|nr:HlyD family secretion protein [Stellaceae bacterium]